MRDNWIKKQTNEQVEKGKQLRIKNVRVKVVKGWPKRLVSRKLT